ncbi:MAG: ParB/RepB/Spo0J family partition protein [Brevundimonas sp.]|uniref:ParB/RepB/Spo0J family partition protein n=1 Tax=Brevundimonas sp. TaxID=1871086 RepID=UPI0039189193
MTDLMADDEKPGTITGGHDGLLTGPDGISMPMRLHPLCSLFPEMPASEFAELVEDVRQNGVRRPLTMLDGMILDGRHRYLAAREVGVGYRTVEFAGENPLEFVISENLRRRHMNESQRAMMAAKLARMEPGRPALKSANVRSISAGAAAQMLNVSTRNVEKARNVQRNAAAPVRQMVERGEVSVSAAEAVSKLPGDTQKALAGQGPEVVRAAARHVRDDQALTRWKTRVDHLLRQADDGETPLVGKASTPISIALHLLVKGHRDAAAMLAQQCGISFEGLAAGMEALTTAREDAERVQRETAIVITAIMHTRIIVEEARTLRPVHDDRMDDDDRMVQAWRQGWADAVLLREPGADIVDPVLHDAALGGADAFRRRFADFMATRL